VSGAHRDKSGNSTLIVPVVVVPVAVIGFIIYLVVKHPSGLLILLGAGDSVVVIQAAHKVVLNLANAQLKSAEQVVNRLGAIAQLFIAVVGALGSVGVTRGWMHGTFRDVITGVLALYLIGSPIYWFGGKRRLIAVLRARTAGDGTGS
jgi:hypothetical protein